MDDHIKADQLERYRSNQLSESETERIILHLSTCDSCLDRVEEKWSEESLGFKKRSEVPVEERLSKIRRRTIRRAYGANLGGHALWLGTAGLFSVFLLLMKPIVKAVQKTEAPDD